MNYELVTSGGLGDVMRLKDYEFAFEEGQRGLLSLNLRTSVPSSIVKELESQLKQKGVSEARVTTGSPKLNIYFKKGSPALALIAAAILALAVLAVLIIGWNLFKQVVPTSLQPAFGTLGLLILMLVIASFGLKNIKW